MLALALIAAAIWGEGAAKAFDVYAFAVYLMIAIGQGVGFSERYGLVMLTGNVALALLVALSWAGSASWVGTSSGGGLRS